MPEEMKKKIIGYIITGIMIYSLLYFVYCVYIAVFDDTPKTSCRPNICGPRYEAIHGKPCPNTPVCISY